MSYLFECGAYNFGFQKLISFLIFIFVVLWGSGGFDPQENFEFGGGSESAILGISCYNFLNLRSFLCGTRNNGGLGIFRLKLRITELRLSTTENTEVSVLITDGWQHCE